MLLGEHMNAIVMVSPYPAKCQSKMKVWAEHGLYFTPKPAFGMGVHKVLFPAGTQHERRLSVKGKRYDVYTLPGGIRFTVGSLDTQQVGTLSQPTTRTFHFLFDHTLAKQQTSGLVHSAAA